MKPRVAVAAVIGLFLSSVMLAAAPVHYLVFEVDDQGRVEPVFYRLVDAAVDTPREHLGRSAISTGGDDHHHSPAGTLVSVQARDDAGAMTYQEVVRVPRVVRGEFHGAEIDSRGFEIEAFRHLTDVRHFVVRLPAVGSDSLVIEVDGQLAEFQLDLLAARSSELAFAAYGGELDSTVRVKEGSGEPSNRVDLLLMGDGFTSSSLFEAEADKLAEAFLAISPYSEYRNFINVTSLFTASAQDGADHPPYEASCQPGYPVTCCSDPAALDDPLAGAFVDTPFDGSYCSFGVQRLLVVDTAAVLAAASAAPDWDRILVLVNDGTYGGSGGFVSVSSVHPLAVDIARHEYGHSFTGLADEYDVPVPGFPECSDIFGPSCEANVTDETNPALIKWEPWIDASIPIPTPEDGSWLGDVGLFEGARYRSTGMYRPRHIDCLMNFLGVPFGEVCTQEYVLELYRGGWGVPSDGIDLIEPGSESPIPGAFETCLGRVTFSADVLQPEGGPALAISWWVDGQLAATDASAFEFDLPPGGSFEIELTVEDTTAFVHPELVNSDLESSRGWTVTSTAPSGIDVSCSEPVISVPAPAGVP